MKISVLLSIVALALVTSKESKAAYQWGFGNLSVNHLGWDQSTKDKSTKTDFTYLEIEGGAQFDWGDLYGFYDIENPGKTGLEARTANKAAMNYYLFGTKISVYASQYTFQSLGFSEQNRVIGVGYLWSGTGWWVKPFLGFHDIVQTFYVGPNGFMGGWVFGYDFNWLGRKFSVIDWHEIEFSRDSSVAAGNGGSSGVNGALSLWYTSSADYSFGIQRRYATNKLGTKDDLGAWIGSLKVLF